MTLAAEILTVPDMLDHTTLFDQDGTISEYGASLLTTELSQGPMSPMQLRRLVQIEPTTFTCNFIFMHESPSESHTFEHHGNGDIIQSTQYPTCILLCDKGFRHFSCVTVPDNTDRIFVLEYVTGELWSQSTGKSISGPVGASD